MSCSYDVLDRLAPEASWSDQATYLREAMTDEWGSPRVGRWETRDFPLRIYFERVPGWTRERREAAEKLVLEAFSMWSDSIVPGLPSFRVVENDRQADLLVRWTPVSIAENANVEGATETAIVRGNRWRGLEIWLLESYVEDGSTELLLKVAAHEMGHALGISGHSPDRGDLMYATVQGASRPSPRDLATLRGLYLCRTKTRWVD